VDHPEERTRLEPPARCTSRSSRSGHGCVGEQGHGGLHHAEVNGVLFAWSDETSPELALDLLSRD